MKAQTKLDIQTRAFEAGSTAALYEHAAEQDLRDLLSIYNGKVGDKAAVEAWNAIAAAWQLGHSAIDTREPSDVVGKPSKTAARAWQRLIKSIGYVKPQSDEAARKKAAREADKATAAPTAKPADKATASPAQGVAGVDPFASIAAAIAPSEPAIQGTPAQSPEAALAMSARATACIELLRSMDDETLKKAQAALLKLCRA